MKLFNNFKLYKKTIQEIFALNAINKYLVNQTNKINNNNNKQNEIFQLQNNLNFVSKKYIKNIFKENFI